MANGQDIDWILTETVKVSKFGDYVVEEVGGSNRRCVISFSEDGSRMLFDGHDIETEDFMAFVGLLDAVDESPTGKAIFDNETVSYE